MKVFTSLGATFGVYASATGIGSITQLVLPGLIGFGGLTIAFEARHKRQSPADNKSATDDSAGLTLG